jgi:DNA-binding transcriptional ArsR family regulator
MSFDVGAMFDALAEPTRRAIFERLVIRPRRATELNDVVPVTRQAVAHHLAVLQRAGLVRKEGANLVVVVEALPAMRTYLDRLWLEVSLGDAWLTARGAADPANLTQEHSPTRLAVRARR